jgi:dinuclear metal center YbgI/SA1388 family protein
MKALIFNRDNYISMKIADVIEHLEAIVPPVLQESYDNGGLITGHRNWECTGIIVCLDATEPVIVEATEKKCNLVIAHHPILFHPIRNLTGADYVQQTLIRAVKQDVAIYAIHTSIDNLVTGVSGKMAQVLGLLNTRVLVPKEHTLEKLYTFVPVEHAEAVRQSIFNAGAGKVGNYSGCSFNSEGIGTFMASEGTTPFIGQQGEAVKANEIKIETIYPAHLRAAIIKAMMEAHPYEEVAYDIIKLENQYSNFGAGAVGELAEPVDEKDFLRLLKTKFDLQVVRHTPLLKRQVRKIALCGGAGSFLISNALSIGADVFVTSDVKYHEFFDANGRMVIADIGHFESERFTIDLLQQLLVEKFPTFAVLKSGIQTNPVNYYL